MRVTSRILSVLLVTWILPTGSACRSTPPNERPHILVTLEAFESARGRVMDLMAVSLARRTVS
jgi:hypothetical protein